MESQIYPAGLQLHKANTTKLKPRVLLTFDQNLG